MRVCRGSNANRMAGGSFMRFFSLFLLLVFIQISFLAYAAPGADERITTLRNIVEKDKKNEKARQALADITVEYAGKIEAAEATGREAEARNLLERIRIDLFDTLWRVDRRAKSGDGKAQAAMGLLHSKGVLAEKNNVKACEFYHKASIQSLPAATYHASLCSAKTDQQRSIDLMLQAATGGHAAAQELVAHACFNLKPQELECAVEWATLAMQQGRPSAMTLLAHFYAEGIGVPQDLPKAFLLCSLAAEEGDATAQYNLGKMYETGSGTDANQELAAQWYRRAAESGYQPK